MSEDRFDIGEASFLNSLSETLIVALTLWGEARGEGLTGMAAVGCVIRNRATHPRVRWWGVGFHGVCLKPKQFSCWNDDDPNRRVLIAMASGHIPPVIQTPFSIAKAVASEIIDMKFPDITGGADHYHSLDVRPKWAEGKAPIKRIGQHVFYRLH
jgi:spore germination cell wall hydrolase CwlJ-like protein